MGPARLAGKQAVVTGAGSGIGAALCRALAARGTKVLCTDIDGDAAARTAAALGPAARAMTVDVTDPAAVQAAVDDVVERAGRIDLMFNNAGITWAADTEALTLAHWNAIIDVNIRGVVHGVAAAYPQMVRQGFGHIVNTASMAGLVTTSAQAGYSATKHAVVALSKTMRVEAATHGVRVSVLCPGVVRTPILSGGAYGRNKSVSREDLVKLGEALRPMDADDFADRALRAVLRNEAIIVVPRWWKALWYLERLSPALSMRTAAAALKRTREVQSAVPPQ